MDNKEIARVFNKLAKIMELHGENPFKIRSYYNAYNTLRKTDLPLSDMEVEELKEIKGVGKAIAEKIAEYSQSGSLRTYDKYAAITPAGVIEMMEVRGFGPKKARTIWKELGIENIGDLLYACNENRLLELKGFGEKTQERLKKQLQYFIDSRGKYLYGYIEDEALQLSEDLCDNFPDFRFELTGEVRRKLPVVEKIEVITNMSENQFNDQLDKAGLTRENGKYLKDEYPVEFYFVSDKNFANEQFKLSASKEFLERVGVHSGKTEADIFAAAKLPYMDPELRDTVYILDQLQNKSFLDAIITRRDIKGLVHCHSTYSDGMHTILEMADEAIQQNLKYMVLTDHSKAAFYADGLSEEDVFRQFEEIDGLNETFDDFHIFKGIEADILSDGSMDYGDDFLRNFDVVIASVHSNLKMTEDKATQRIVRAIENPNTHILGHPTGRLLLSREGYPIDHMKIIDACAANGMVIELNANPHRLDLDWTWIPYAIEKEVMISVNPDSHNKSSIDYIKFGVYAARKGGLTKDLCLNAKGLGAFKKWVQSLK